MSTPLQFTTPAGRLVQGSLYRANDKDAEGRPLIIKNGPKTGQGRVEYYVALAIPKEKDAAGQIKHWATSDWGSKIWQAGHQFMSNAGQLGTNFAWKVRDGDSTQPNKKGKIPAMQEGFPGHWVLSCASGFPPNCYSLIGVPPGGKPLVFDQQDAINLGDWVQVSGNVDGNGAQNQPGVFVNMNMVCLIGYGVRIVVGPDVDSAGFGNIPLPAGASTVPPAGFTPPTPAIPGAPGHGVPPMPAPPGASMPTPTMPAPPTTVPSSIAPPTVVPNPAMIQVPGTQPIPVPGSIPMPPAPGPQRYMTPKAQGATYEQMVGQGWTDALLQQHGMMVVQ